jgi:hypothetical protein
MAQAPKRETIWPWPLPAEVTKYVCNFAGRDASAALCTALGRSANAGGAREGMFCEPFTYWDWRGLPKDNTVAKRQKRQRTWEHQKGFKAGVSAWKGYPTSRERWEMFKRQIEDQETKNRIQIEKDKKLGLIAEGMEVSEKDKWVKTIAVAHWMEIEDLRW